MQRTVVEWRWEDPASQAVFSEWVGFPSAEATAAEVDRVEALVGLRPPARVLDAGCGTGRQTVELAARGYAVVGIDVAAAYVAQARAAAEARRLAVDFRVQRGSELVEEAAFDLVLAFNHTLGFMDDAELARHLRRLRAALKPAGTFLLTLAGPTIAPGRERHESRTWAERDGRFILSHHLLEGGYRTETSIVIDPERSEIVEFRERQRAFALDGILALLRTAGFGQIDCFADLDGAAATPGAFGVFRCRRER